MITHAEGSFEGLKGLNIYYQSWHPEEEPKAVLLLVHGYAEHSGRYRYVAEHFAKLGYAIYALDHRGHGKSEGERAYVDRFEDYVEDLKRFLEIVKGKEPRRPVFLVGHSMGGAIAVLFAIRYQQELAGLILSGAGVKVSSEVSPLMIRLSRLLATITPRLGLVPLDASTVSRDPEVVARYDSDPLNYRGKVKARTAVEIMRAAELIRPEMRRITLPILIMHGTEDRLVDPAASQMLYDGVGSTDKTLKWYEGFYHEVFNDLEKERVFADMAAWLEAQLLA